MNGKYYLNKASTRVAIAVGLVVCCLTACAVTDPAGLLTMLMTLPIVGIALKINGKDEKFDGIQALRERAAQLREKIKELGDAFNSRKAKRDAGEEVELWPGETRTEWDHTGEALDTVQAAITEEDEAAKVASRLASSSSGGTRSDDRLPIGGRDEPEHSRRRIIIPAQSVFSGRLRAFQGEEAKQDAYACGQWVRSLLGHLDAVSWVRDHRDLIGLEGRAQVEGVNAKGGVLVPPQMAMAIIRLVEEYGVAARECEPIPMSSDTFSQPRRTGGVTLYPLGEGQAITDSETGWDAIQLTARKWGGLVKYSSELNDDAVIRLADFLAREMAWAIRKKQDESLFLGDGSNTYHGIVGLKVGLQAGSEVTAATGNTAFSTLDLTDFESMVGKLPDYAEENAKWYISKAGWAASMMRLQDAAGGNTAQIIAGRREREFIGYPVVITQVTNSVLTAQTSTEGLCYFGDMEQTAMLGMRGDIRLKVAEERYIDNDQLGFFAFVRFDINCHEVGDASTAGSMIQLITPGS